MTDYLAAFILGLVSSGHCLGMCGGLMIAAGFNSTTPSVVMGYNIGRITTYMLLGASFGFISALLPQQFLPVLKIMSAILLIFTAFYLMGLSQLINKLDVIGLPLWRVAQSFGRKLLPVKTVRASFMLGTLWGLIPCGLVYTALAFSLAQQAALSSSIIMLCFGLGTFPSMIGASTLAVQLQPWITHPSIRKILAVILLIFAIVMLINTFL